MENITNVIIAQHPEKIVYITEAYDFNGNSIPGLGGSTDSLEKMLYHLESINFHQGQRFISQVPKVDDPRANILRELTEEEKQYLGRFFGTTITDRLLEYTLKHREPYEVKVRELELTVFPNVFPPSSPFSYDSIPLAEMNDTRKGEIVLDIGTGTGIHAVISGLRGARKVIATDISEEAVNNCKYNAEKNGLGRIIQARQGNLFDPIIWYEKIRGFDLIIANLPFVNNMASEFYEHWVYDENYKTHQEFFSKVGGYLKPKGRILIAFSDIGDTDFFEDQIKRNKFLIKDKEVKTKIDKKWMIYRLER
jgi:release factor glutamine methyltransferase